MAITVGIEVDMTLLATKLTEDILKHKGIMVSHPCYQRQFQGYYDSYIEIITEAAIL